MGNAWLNMPEAAVRYLGSLLFIPETVGKFQVFCDSAPVLGQVMSTHFNYSSQGIISACTHGGMRAADDALEEAV